jgi:hypothetical protein
MLVVGTEYDIFATFVFDVLAEYFIQTVCLFKSMAKRLEISLTLIADSFAFSSFDSALIFLKVFFGFSSLKT